MEKWLSALPQLPAALPPLPVPLWMAGVGAGVVLFILIILIWIAGFRRLFRFVFTYGFVAAVLGGGYFAFREYENTNQRKLLEERASSVFSQTIQPGSVYACIDGSPSPAMQDACERTLFAEPQRVATAVTITSQRVAYLIDAVRFARERDPNYMPRIAPLRRVVEADPYGFVGFVMSSIYNCMAELCDKFQIFDYPDRVQENIRSRRYEAYMVKYAGVWRGEPLPEEKKASDAVLPGVAIGDKPRTLIPLDAGPPALFDPVPRGNPMPSGPILGPHTTPPAAATPPDVIPPPTVGGPPRASNPDRSTSPFAGQAKGNGTSPTPVSVPAQAAPPAAPPPATRPIIAEPEEKGQKKSAPPKSEQAKGEPKGSEKAAEKQKAAAAGAPKSKGELYRAKGSEPVAGLPRLVPGDYRRPDPNEPRETPTPSGVIMSPNP